MFVLRISLRCTAIPLVPIPFQNPLQVNGGPPKVMVRLLSSSSRLQSLCNDVQVTYPFVLVQHAHCMEHDHLLPFWSTHDRTSSLRNALPISWATPRRPHSDKATRLRSRPKPRPSPRPRGVSLDVPLITADGGSTPACASAPCASKARAGACPPARRHGGRGRARSSLVLRLTER